MSTQGTTTVDFGSRETSVSKAITGQASILAGSLVEAWLFPALTASNQPDNHWFDDFTVMAGTVVAGTGFTITVKCNQGVAHGIFNIGWVWN
jgi:hypothetical protein